MVPTPAHDPRPAATLTTPRIGHRWTRGCPDDPATRATGGPLNRRWLPVCPAVSEASFHLVTQFDEVRQAPQTAGGCIQSRDATAWARLREGVLRACDEDRSVRGDQRPSCAECVVATGSTPSENADLPAPALLYRRDLVEAGGVASTTAARLSLQWSACQRCSSVPTVERTESATTVKRCVARRWTTRSRRNSDGSQVARCAIGSSSVRLVLDRYGRPEAGFFQQPLALSRHCCCGDCSGNDRRGVLSSELPASNDARRTAPRAEDRRLPRRADPHVRVRAGAITARRVPSLNRDAAWVPVAQLSAIAQRR